MSKNTNATASPVTEEEKFYMEWGKETLKTNIERANNVLQQFLTLNTALLGGSVVFLSQEILGKMFHGISIACLFIGLVLAFLGIIPYESKVQLNIPADIKNHKEKALKDKRCFLWATAIATGSGLLIAAIGVLIA